MGKTFGGPKDATVFYKELHTFKCIPPDGYPKPRFVEWRKDGVPITTTILDNDNARILTSQGGISLLQIKSAEQKNAGEYSCVAKNAEGVRISPASSLRIIARGILGYVYHFLYNSEKDGSFKKHCLISSNRIKIYSPSFILIYI